MEKRKESKTFRIIAEKVIKKREELKLIEQSGVDIIYLISDHAKKKKGLLVYADCEKVPDKWKWAVPADFIITVYEPNAALLSAEQKEILIYHELLHVGIEEDYSMRGFRFYVAPHDIEDFDIILKEFGLDWNLPKEKKH